MPLERVQLLPPVTTNQQFICQGVNYRSHIAESGLRVEDFPFNTIFTKAPSCITAADAPVVRPAHVQLLDYEIELGLVLRRPLPAGTQVGRDDLSEWLAGVTIVNDLSARDVQLPQGPVLQGQELSRLRPGRSGAGAADAAGMGALARAAHAPGGQRPAAAGRLLRRDDPWPRSHAHRARVAARPAPRRPDRHRHAGGLRRARARQGSRCSSLKHLLSDAGKWRMFVRKGRANPAYLRPGDRISASIRTDDGAIDLGEQTTSITAP